MPSSRSRTQRVYGRVHSERGAQPGFVENCWRFRLEKVLRLPLPQASRAAEDGPERRVRGRCSGRRGRGHYPDRVQGTAGRWRRIFVLFFFLFSSLIPP